MSITANDIKLMQPERLTDNSDGGGSMTGLPVIDAEINNLFEDISRINRTYGNTSLRKAFLKVDTATADLYLDAHAIIAAQPNDPNVTGLLFTTDNFYDERAEARQRIESFVIASSRNGLRLRGNQNQGQRSIIAYSGVNSTPAPASGDTFMLQVGEDISTRQFIKVTEVIESNEVFTYTRSEGGNTVVKNFPVRQWIISISTELERDYPNTDPHPYDEQTSFVHDTTPSVSAKYYGTSKLAAPITAGATSLQVENTFAPIIPTASTETAVIDQRPGGFVDTFIPTSEPITININTTVGVAYLPTGILPGSLTFTKSGVQYFDKNDRIERANASTTGFEQVQIDYVNGVLTFLDASEGTTNQAITYTPAATRTLVPHTGSLPITENNRNFNYVLQLNALPAKRSFSLSYQYLNKWYTLRDDGTGNLTGDGSGQINYESGSVAIVVTAQPDANSVLFYQWTDRDDYSAGEGSAFSGETETRLKLAHDSINPNSVTISWTQSGAVKTVTDNGTGELTGDTTGSIAYSSGLIAINGLPDAGEQWNIDYTFDPPAKRQSNPISIAANTSRSNFTLTLTPDIKPGSVRFSLVKRQKKRVKQLLAADTIKWRNINMSFQDDGNGNIKRVGAFTGSYGTINYATGVVTMTGNAVLDQTTTGKERWEKDAFQNNNGIQNETVVVKVTTSQELAAQETNVQYVYDSETPEPANEIKPRNAFKWQFELTSNEPVVPGSVILKADDEYWFDDKAGRIVRNYSTATGVGTAIGTIEYETGSVAIDDYTGRPANANITPVSVLVGDDFNVILATTFRTTNSPLRPSGFTLRAEDGEGGSFTAADDGSGTLSGTAISQGTVDQDDGLIYAKFSTPMDAATLFYNAVSYKSIPLSSDILGLDPVRLPSDGRVPIFRDAGILVLTHTQKDEITTPSAGLVVDAGRTTLHDGWIEDQAGTRLKADQATLDKEAGTITLANPFNAVNDADQPLTGSLFFMHRIDDMALCSEARIDGKLTLAQPIAHDYPEASWVASAVHLGNLQARVKNLRSFKTDPGYNANGVETDAKYNDIAYPVAIDNNGSVPDRWMIKFNSSTAFSLYSEERGLVETGSIAVDFSPTNPQTGTPYFTIKSAGWGSGWSVGNAVFFDTDAAAAPLWMIRTVLPGQATENDDKIKFELRGDHN